MKRSSWSRKRSQKPRIKAKQPRRAKSIPKLKKELWKVFSLFIRQRDGYKCFTCGRIGYGLAMHAGHFIARSVGGIALYFNEDNVHAQCYHCNINLGGNQYEYALRLGDKAKELYALKNLNHKVDEAWYLSMIKYYKKRLADLTK